MYFFLKFIYLKYQSLDLRIVHSARMKLHDVSENK